MGVLDFVGRMLVGRDETVDIVDAYGFRLGHIDSLPTCNEARRGQQRRVMGGTGVADQIKVCEKNDADVYAWTAITPAAISSPLTTKGDLYGYDTTDARVPVGADGEVLTADSADAQGVSWQAITAPGSALVLIGETSFSTATSVSLPDNTFTANYENYLIIVEVSTVSANASWSARMRAGGANNTNASYDLHGVYGASSAATVNGYNGNGLTNWGLGTIFTGGSGYFVVELHQPQAAVYTRGRFGTATLQGSLTNLEQISGGMVFLEATQFDSMSFIPGSGNATGKVRVYGYQNSPGDPGPSGFTDEDAQDAVGLILLDSASINFTYDDGVPSLTAVVLPGGVDHNALANLTTGDPHTQYALEAGATFTGDIVVPAEVYGAGWNGSNEAPTKNDVYDQVELLMPKAGGTFTGDIIVPDEAYAVGWNGSLEAPTKNALYDELEAHKAAADPHPGYLTPAEGNAAYQPLDADLTALAGIAGVDGDIIYRTAGAWTRLAKGTQDQSLSMNLGATAPEWSDEERIVARFRLAADGAAIGPAAANLFGANSAFSTTANTLYLFEAHVGFLKSTAGTVLFTLVHSTNLAQGWLGFVAPGVLTGNAGIVGTTSIATLASGSLTTAVNHYMHVVGMVETNTAGNLRLNITSSGGTVTPRRHSRYTLRRLTTGNIGGFVA